MPNFRFVCLDMRLSAEQIPPACSQRDGNVHYYVNELGRAGHVTTTQCVHSDTPLSSVGINQRFPADFRVGGASQSGKFVQLVLIILNS